MTRTWATAFSFAAAVALLAACGSDGGDSDGTDPGAAGDSLPGAEVTTTTRSVITTAASGASSTAETPAGIPDFVFGVDEVVRFEAGGTSAVLSNGVIRGERNRYTLEAAAGQTLNLSITSVEDNAVFDVYGPDEIELEAEVTSTSIVLPSDGVYTVIVGGTRGNASYELTVEIPAS